MRKARSQASACSCDTSNHGDHTAGSRGSNAAGGTRGALGLRLRRGQVNTTKTLETFDFGFNSTINRQQIFESATCAFIRQKRNALICGQTGVGKTHVAQALAHEAARQGVEVLYTTADHLLRDLHAGCATTAPTGAWLATWRLTSW